MNMEEKALTVSSGSYLMPAMQMQQAVDRYNLLVGFVRQIMRPDIHYGIIPGTTKPTLLKPGAEMLTTFFGLTPRFITVKEAEDWSGAQSGGDPFFYYRFTCQLWRGDIMVAEADGSCNSHESRYRWRWVGEDDLPEGLDKATLKKRGGTVSEFGFAIDKAETGGKYGKPAAYWQQFKDAIDNGIARPLKKATKAGKTYDAWEIDSTIYRVPNNDVADLANTILKMAQKRAYIAATLIGVNASEFFTQDMEDLDIVEGHFTEVQTAGPTWDVETVKAGEPPAPAPKPAPEKRAIVKTRQWPKAAAELAKAVPYYAKDGQPDFYHMLGAAAKLGYSEVTDANLPEVLDALSQYARDKQELRPQELRPLVDADGNLLPAI